MLKVTEDDIVHELDRYLQSALTQTVVIEKPDREPVVVLSLSEFERLRDIDERHWQDCARQANKEGYLDHEREVRQRLAAALRQKRLACAQKKSPV